jgi:hypothetical protein
MGVEVNHRMVLVEAVQRAVTVLRVGDAVACFAGGHDLILYPTTSATRCVGTDHLEFCG